MGSYCSIKFDEVDILDWKSTVPDIFISLFQESDRHESVSPDSEADDEPSRVVTYSASRYDVLQRLDVIGFTSEAARESFERWRADECEVYEEWAEEGYEWGAPGLEAIQNLSYENWSKRTVQILKTRYDDDAAEHPMDETEKHMREREDGWLFYDVDDLRYLLRSFLDANVDVKTVALDVSDLIDGGWLNEDEKICAAARARGPSIRPILEPIVIMAEGSSDIDILRQSLAAMYPHLTDYFSFFEHQELSVDGGANYLVKFLKAFAAARIRSRIIALFDNDAIGVQSFRIAKGLGLPENMRVVKLPDIDIARKYPTVGPQGAHDVDVNGTGASIELYLGRANLISAADALSPIRWMGYVAGVDRYQGVVENKEQIVSKFNASLALSKNAASALASYPELASVWLTIFDEVRDIPHLHGE